MADKRPFKPYPAGSRYAEEDRLKALGIVTPKPKPKPWPVTSDKTDRLTVPAKISSASPHALDPAQRAMLADSKKFKSDTSQSLSKLGANVLHGYRSSTYNFVLSALDKATFSPGAPPPTLSDFRSSSNRFMILSSSGKGDRKIEKSDQTLPEAAPIVDGFNALSPGRFDLFIDNVEIESMFSFDKNSTVTLPMKFKFDVYEPYSINGFVEALHTAALAAGYANYAEASFLLRMSFNGYSDQSKENRPTSNIAGAERFFVIKLTGFQIDITEKGTRYMCAAIPYNDSVMSDVENRLQQNIQVQGVTIETILTNFGKDLTSQRRESEENAKNPPPPSYDEYQIEFAPPLDGASSELKYFKESVFSTFGKESQIFIFTDPQKSTGKNGYSNTKKDFTIIDEAGRRVDRYGNPVRETAPVQGGSVINFSANTNITDCISAVIVESSWHRSLLNDLPAKIDIYGMVNYFSIRMEVQNKPELDTAKNRPYQIFKYIISLYKIHYSKIPNYESQKINYKGTDLSKLAYRNYEYIYTGNNVDVINFKIHFDHLYYEAMSRAGGNSDAIGATTSPGQSDTFTIKSQKPANKSADEIKSVIPSPPKYSVSQIHTGPTASQPLWSDPFYIMSKNMYESIVNSSVGMVRGDLEILGDPFFLAMGGQGNYKPETAGYGVTKDGAVDLYNGQVFVEITFKNPDDIKSVFEGGKAKFSENRISFSGVYMVTKVTSKFSGGVFKQKLNILRMLQTDKNTSTTPAKEVTQTFVNIANATAVDGKGADVTQLGTP